MTKEPASQPESAALREGTLEDPPDEARRSESGFQPAGSGDSKEAASKVEASEVEASEVEAPTFNQRVREVREATTGAVAKLSGAAKHQLHEAVTRWSSQIARRNLLLLAAQGNLAETLRDIPEQMHLVARQARLVIEFFDDFRSGAYREMPWWAVAIAATAMLYAINPADAVPNVIPFVGTLDDLAVVAVAVRILRRELIKYCEFKGYPVEEYFRV